MVRLRRAATASSGDATLCSRTPPRAVGARLAERTRGMRHAAPPARGARRGRPGGRVFGTGSRQREPRASSDASVGDSGSSERREQAGLPAQRSSRQRRMGLRKPVAEPDPARLEEIWARAARPRPIELAPERVPAGSRRVAAAPRPSAAARLAQWTPQTPPRAAAAALGKQPPAREQEPAQEPEAPAPAGPGGVRADRRSRSGRTRSGRRGGRVARS